MMDIHFFLADGVTYGGLFSEHFLWLDGREHDR